jgi:uroporphyrinogen III methyltransferase/synthase
LKADADAGKRFLLARANRGREVLAEQLAAAGGTVEQIAVYTSRDVAACDPEIEQALATGGIDWITVTSSEIARSLAHLFGNQLGEARLASISPLTSATLRELGYEVAAEANPYTTAGLVDAICRVQAGLPRSDA